MAKSIALGGAKPSAQPRLQSRTPHVVAFVAIVVVIVALWEGAKRLFALPDYKLPHISMIFESLMRPTPEGVDGVGAVG